MLRKFAALSVALTAAVLAACAGHYGGNANSNGATFAIPGMPNLSFTAKLPSGAGPAIRYVKGGTIKEELPDEGLGTVHDTFWHATMGHFSQQQFSQALGFRPGTQITIKNVSNTTLHTLNVVKEIAGPPAKFPRNPSLSLSPSGGKLQKGYASGIIYPGQSVTVTLGKAGIYLIACAYHYNQGMKDVIVVAPDATPGPQGTAPPSP